MPLRHVLEIVTLSTDTRFTRNGDKITILWPPAHGMRHDLN